MWGVVLTMVCCRVRTRRRAGSQVGSGVGRRSEDVIEGYGFLCDSYV